MRCYHRSPCVIVLAVCVRLCAAADDDYPNSLQSFLHENFDGKNYGMVIGLIDEQGSRVYSAGKLDKDTDQEVNGDTVFEIGSMTKTFTTLLLEDMVARGEMQLDDPVSRYLPDSVKVPSRGGRIITLANLASQDSGLPRDPDDLPNIQPPENPYADYSAEKLYAFLSGCRLQCEPGAEFGYSNPGMALLGHAITRTAKTDYESLLVDRICRPLRMDSTRIRLTPQLKARLAIGHDEAGRQTPNWDFQVYEGAGAIRSTANDLLKYLAANLGLMESELGPLMMKTHEIRHHGGTPFGDTAMPWMDRNQSVQSGTQMLGHAGGTAGYHTFIGFSRSDRRGVVVLSNQQGIVESEPVGWLILERIELTHEIVNILVNTREKELVGIGVALEFDRPSHTIRIGKVLPDSPAEKAGMSAGLVVKKVGDVAIANKTLLQCQSLIRGAAGTKVQLELQPADGGETKTLEIVRGKFQI